MSKTSKDDQALAVIAALQSILDRLPEGSEMEESGDGQANQSPVKDPTHELFVGRLDQHSLAGLFTSIRIIHSIHAADK